MEKHHKEALRKNRVALVQDMDLTYVFDGLVKRNIFEPAAYEDFKAEGKTRRKINQLFLNALERRGPRAFGAFVESLREHKHGILANKLDPASAPRYPAQMEPRPGREVNNPMDFLLVPQVDAKPEPMDTYPTQPLNSPPEDLQEPLWPGSGPAAVPITGMTAPTPTGQDDSDVENIYQMNSEPRGIAIIINNQIFVDLELREGSDIDRNELRNLFEMLGFRTVVKDNQTKQEMQATFYEFSKHDHGTLDCFVLAILSHGKEGAIYGVDGDTIQTEHIMGYFEGGRCPTLAGKPKLFFLQACRGRRKDYGFDAPDANAVAPSSATGSTATTSHRERSQRMLEHELEDRTDIGSAIRSKLPCQSDMLLAYSTVPDFVSWRTPGQGSWFVQSLCEVFRKYYQKEDLVSMLVKVNKKVARAYESSCGRRCKQMPAPVVMLCKKLFFPPVRAERGQERVQFS